MVNVEQITIDLTLPTDEVSVVAMQPYLNLQSDEPFKIREDQIDDQINAIRKTLDIAQNGFNESSAHFTIFPEYSIPGLRGLELIDEAVSSKNWANGSVIIAGVHGLTKVEFYEVCERFEAKVADENKPERVQNEKWVNCFFMWVKEDNGEIKRFIQLKIRPAWPEINVAYSDMFHGSTIYVFNCKFKHDVFIPCSFTTFICFDWVAQNNGQIASGEMLKNLQDQLSQDFSLHWIFVIQHNKNPNHSSFLNSTKEYLTDPYSNYPRIRRNEAVVLHLNTAANDKPTKLSKSTRGAFSSCVIAPTNKLDYNGCRPTICMQPDSFRGSNILKDAQCIDVVFREIGECIHLFKVKVPRFLGSGAANRTFPIPLAEVHSIKGTYDPRFSGKQIPASVKWFNDSLDIVNSLANTSFDNCPLHNEAKNQHGSIISEMRLIEDGMAITRKINWAACCYKDRQEIRNKKRRENSDLWYFDEALEYKALEHIIHTLTNFGIVYELKISKATFHGVIVLKDNLIHIIAVQGERYSDCRKHYDEHVIKVENDPVIVVFCDNKNHKPTKEDYTKFYETDVDSGEKFIDYHTLVSISRDTDKIQILKEKIDEHLPSERRII